jgi:hypothetical protein
MRSVDCFKRSLRKNIIQKAEKVSLREVARAICQKGDGAGRLCGSEKRRHLRQQAQGLRSAFH